MTTWYKEQGEYVLGALFGLVTLDIFMFLIHCITQRTTEGYNLTTLVISGAFFAIAYFEYAYSHQEQH